MLLFYMMTFDDFFQDATFLFHESLARTHILQQFDNNVRRQIDMTVFEIFAFGFDCSKAAEPTDLTVSEGHLMQAFSKLHAC